jgi:putative tricarboxylic transport membrane protein
VRINDAVFGGALLAVALAVLLQALTFPEMPGQHYGPALFPSLIAGGFGICGVILCVQGVRRLAADGGLVRLEPWARSGGRLLDVVLILAGVAAYVLLSARLGFLLAGGGLLFVWILRFRGARRAASSLAIAFLAALAIDYAFRRVLLVPLPLGPLAGLIW